jgi:hypothetical protein
MYSPEDISKARRDAGFHLEICIAQTQATPTQPGRVLIQGLVTQVFFACLAIRLGHPVAFWVDSLYSDQRAPPGEDVRLDVEDLVAGRYIEAYFVAHGFDRAAATPLEVALRQVAVYDVSSPVGRL